MLMLLSPVTRTEFAAAWRRPPALAALCLTCSRAAGRVVKAAATPVGCSAWVARLGSTTCIQARHTFADVAWCPQVTTQRSNAQIR
jgi:hypothetical protein